MDSIFVKCNSIFTVVRIAKDEPRRYDKKGNPIINYEDTDMAERRGSVLSTRSAKARMASMAQAKEIGTGGSDEEKLG